MGRDPSTLVLAFFWTSTATPVTVTEAESESKLYVDELLKLCAALHPRVQLTLSMHKKHSSEAASKGHLPDSSKRDYVLVARSDFRADEKLFLRWRGPRRVVKDLNHYVDQVGDLHIDELNDFHASRLKLFCNCDIDQVAIMSHVLQSKTSMVVPRLLSLEYCPGDLHVRVRWIGLSKEEDSPKPIDCGYKDVPQLFVKLLKSKSTPVDLAMRAHADPNLRAGGV